MAAMNTSETLFSGITSYHPHEQSMQLVLVCFTDEQNKAQVGSITHPRLPNC